MRRAGNVTAEFDVVDYAVARWREMAATADSLPPAFVDARSISPTAHVEMQAALQPYVDGAAL